MSVMRRTIAAAVAGALLAVVACIPAHAEMGGAYQWHLPPWMPPPPVPADNPMTVAKVELGRHLFYDGRLSLGGAVACASCHLQSLAFADGRALGVGVENIVGTRNPPGLANIGYFPRLTWANPNLQLLETHTLLPIFGDNPVEMGMDGKEQAIYASLAADPVYQRLFPAAFPERRGEISLFTVTRALGAFERSLTSADSPYDRYKHGQPDAISPEAKRGEALFHSARLGCGGCHTAIDHPADASAQKRFYNNGLYNLDGKGAYPLDNRGLIDHTDVAADMGKFRVAPLRNVAMTAPYMHDGSLPTLEAVIAHYERGGVDGPLKDARLKGFALTTDERAELLAFLRALTDIGFASNPAFADPWPVDHPATAKRRMTAGAGK